MKKRSIQIDLYLNPFSFVFSFSTIVTLNNTKNIRLSSMVHKL